MLARCILVLASLLVGAVLTELTLKLASRRGAAPSLHVPAGYGNEYVYIYAPFSSGGTYDTAAKFNNLGMRRDADVSEVPDRGAIRILSYGDSVAFGFALPSSDTYVYRSEKLLNSGSNRRFEVLNMARGHTPTVHLAHLQVDIPKLRPKVVVQEIELTNDISDEVFVRFARRGPEGLPGKLQNARYIVSWDNQSLHSGYPMIGPYFRTTYLYTMVNRAAMTARTYLNREVLHRLNTQSYYFHRTFDASFLTEEALGSAFDQMFRSIRAGHALAKRHGSEYFVLLVPSQYLIRRINAHYDATSALTTRALERLKHDGVPYLFVLDRLRETGLGPEELYFDFCHPKAIAHDAIGKMLSERILEILGPGH